ncbi:uncharacterized protein LOC115761450 [Drosophila novamexicana]|uniref:uncharacterized protein LOC115761450 n=1 Tax=Drosophila novamexicana TaxID=47314 RepID=UPI0011E5CEBB|nr:uncharacterized protein LOC115761450 [Drosophila novamexicana]
MFEYKSTSAASQELKDQLYNIRTSPPAMYHDDLSPGYDSLSSVHPAKVHSKVNVAYHAKVVQDHERHKKPKPRMSDALRGKNVPLYQQDVYPKAFDFEQTDKLERKLSLTINRSEKNTKRASYIKSVEWDQESWVLYDRVFNDQFDISQHPSYTIKNVAYNLECEVVYMEAREKYNAHFRREMESFIASKRTAGDQFFTRRLLSYTSLWPPLHTKAELNIFIKKFFQLTPAQKKRLHFLMTTDFTTI